MGKTVQEHFADTKFGFEWGAAKVTRMMSDDRGVVIGLETPRTKRKDGVLNPIQIYITPTGKVRVHGADGKEWKPS